MLASDGHEAIVEEREPGRSPGRDKRLRYGEKRQAAAEKQGAEKSAEGSVQGDEVQARRKSGVEACHDAKAVTDGEERGFPDVEDG
ncbi:hypothetical protein E3C22_21355 [Jiella endophytica]|uniref:Uncharacterized protein n=1 Tax=Jiella endophytica TaxID=2558362 RepID=A0A4Y8RAR7_9HYPH|nr:hypothetical protein [Jiella endophytica]TFF18770.1 hypothetical protein E3C22_21355 [Jiella endophytica]